MSVNTADTQELLELVIVNLAEFADLDYLEDLCKLVKDSEYDQFLSPLLSIKKYYLKNKIFPSKNYWKKHWRAEINDEEWLREYSYELLAKLRTEVVYKKVSDIINKDPDADLLTELQKCLYNYTPTKKNKDFDENNLADSMRNVLEKKKERGAGLLTYTSLDKYTYGCPFGATTVIGAKPKSGKSNLAMGLAWGAVTKQDLKGIYISLEMSADVIYQRLFSRYMYDKGVFIDNADIIKGKMSPEDEKIYLDNLDAFEAEVKGKLCVVTQENLPALTKMELESFLLRKQEEMGGLDFLIVDQVSLLKYFSGINGKGVSSSTKTFDIINEYVRYFTMMSYTLFEKKIAVILLSQVKREEYATVDKRKPLGLEIFAESSEIERSCNVAVAIRLDDQLKNSNLFELVLLLNRDGDNNLEYMPNVFIPKHCYVGSLGEEVQQQDISATDSSSLMSFMEEVGDDEDLDDIFN